MYILWAALGSAIIIMLEVLFRRGVSWSGHWWLYVPLAVAVNFTVYKTVTSSPTYLQGIIMFPLFNGVARIFMSQFVLHEPIVGGNLLAAMALLIAAIGGRVWR